MNGASAFDLGTGGRSTPFVISVRCHYCSKARSPREVVNLGGVVKRTAAGVVREGQATMCWACYERHCATVKYLGSGELPKGCMECGTSMEALRAREADGNARLWVHWKDGIYQMLCRGCSDAYEKRRLDLYGDTAYGHMRKLKGAK